MKYLFLFLLNLAGICTNAQKNINHLKVSSGVEITTGLFAEGYNTGWGIYVADYYGLSKSTSATLSTGAAFWNSKEGGHVNAGISLTRLGLQQFFGGGFYFQLDGGVGIGLRDWNGTNKFVFGAGPGYLFKLKNGSGLDFSTRVNRGFSRTWIGLGLGYQFKL